MFLLPTFNALLQPCHISPAEFSAHPAGHFCGSCQRVVQDFSQSANPVADLAAARAAAPDGQVCGSFRAAQVVAPPPLVLTRRLKCFLVCLVLVVGQGLTAHEALAQVRRPVALDLQQVPKSVRNEQINTLELEQAIPIPPDAEVPVFFGVVVELMPTFRGGEMKNAAYDIQKRVIWPTKHGKIILAQGRVFVNFTVGTDGQVHNAQILKSFNPLFNAAVLHAVQTTQGFKPGKQNGHPVATGLTLPITFTLK